MAAVARADAIVVLAPGVGTALVERGADPNLVHLVSNGADLVPPLDDRTPARAALGAGADDVLVVYAGAHGPANGLDLALDAAADLAVDHPEVRFVFVGDGPTKAALVERAEREQLANVRFEDARPKSAMPEVLGAADVGLHVLADVGLFTFGVSPNKVFDYLAAGLPGADQRARRRRRARHRPTAPAWPLTPTASPTASGPFWPPPPRSGRPWATTAEPSSSVSTPSPRGRRHSKPCCEAPRSGR